MDYPPNAGSWTNQAPALEKSSELYIRDHPQRSIAIVSSSYALVLRYSSAASEPNGNNGARPRPSAGDVAKCMVEFAPISRQLLRDYRPLSTRPVYGTLGLISINQDVFLSVITGASRAATVRPGETVERISSVAFYCLSSADYDDVVPLELGSGDGTEMSDSSSTYSSDAPYGQGLSRRDVVMEHPCHELRKLLGNGSFYYSTDFDITNRLQNRTINSSSFEIDNFDATYLWNSFMISPLVEFRSKLRSHERKALDRSRILTSTIRGFCQTVTLPQSISPLRSRSGSPSFLTLISRLSCLRAGTRFNSRGIDDDGRVANFVETETIFWTPSGTLFSYVQVRGSVPVFWEQAADLIPGRQKITITRSPDGTQPAFNKHFQELEQMYGAVHVINLLSRSRQGEAELTALYENGIHHSSLGQNGVHGGHGSSKDHALLRETHYDFHAETKGPAGYEAARGIRQYIEDSTDGFAYYLAEGTTEGTADEDGNDEDSSNTPGLLRMVVVLQQEGVFRTNCLDCLDRTNLIQSFISQMATETFLDHRGSAASSDFWARHSSLWADNGDSLSKIYAGTGALKSSYTRHGKMSLAGAVADMRKSVQRIYHNNFVDPSRQVTIDMLLGRLVGQAAVHLFDPISDFVSVELGRRSDEFTSQRSVSLWVGTFNLNGRTDGLRHDLSPWLFPPAIGAAQPDIYVVGFQEIVELSPQQIMSSDPSRKALWEKAVKNALNRRQERVGGDRYVLLRSGQLVGAALCVFVKTSALDSIKNVEGSVKKTGLSGIAGNKGAVAIRFDYANTKLCFVTAHLAAGFANYDERNRDYMTIHHGLRFQRNRSIDDHDAVIWLGDFNYRVGLSLEATRGLIRKHDLETLYENDQLNLQMVAGLAFPFYSEARITFMPTYKFDVGKDEYDTSEKARIPAWTDRILRKGNLRQLLYDSAPLRFSDHRPVYAAFECKVNLVDEARREAISQELYRRRKEEVGDPVAGAKDSDETDDEDLIGYDAIEPGLPPASSDRQKWWLDNGHRARAQISVPLDSDGHPMVLNPQRASNPFSRVENEEEWIPASRSTPQGSTMPARKLPPQDVTAAMNLHAKVARMNIHGAPSEISSLLSSAATTPPPPPPPRRQTGAMNSVSAVSADPVAGSPQAHLRPVSAASNTSHTSTISQHQSLKSGKSPPPPVAKKPAHLSAAASPAGPAPSPRSFINSTSPSRGGITTTTTTTTSTAPPLPSRKGTAMSAVAPSSDLAGRWQHDGSGGSSTGTGNVYRKPAPYSALLQAKQGIGAEVAAAAVAKNKKTESSQVDLLDSLDGGGQDVGGWETLQPTNKR